MRKLYEILLPRQLYQEIRYSFLRLKVRQVFKGGNYWREETIFFLIFGSLHGNLNCCQKVMLDISYEAHLKVKLTCNYTLISLTLKKIMYLVSGTFAWRCPYLLMYLLTYSICQTELIYRGLTRRWSFIFFPKSFQNLSQNCKFLFCLYFSVSHKSKIKNLPSYFLKCIFWS